MAVLASGSLYCRESLPGLWWLVLATEKMSLWRDFVVVVWAKRLQIWSRLESSRSRPSSCSWSVRERVQWPTMAAMVWLKTVWLILAYL